MRTHCDHNPIHICEVCKITEAMLDGKKRYAIFGGRRSGSTFKRKMRAMLESNFFQDMVSKMAVGQTLAVCSSGRITVLKCEGIQLTDPKYGTEVKAKDYFIIEEEGELPS